MVDQSTIKTHQETLVGFKYVDELQVEHHGYQGIEFKYMI